jgi:hypothetical protein
MIAVTASGRGPGAKPGGSVAGRPVAAKVATVTNGATIAPTPMQVTRIVHGSSS